MFISLVLSKSNIMVRMEIMQIVPSKSLDLHSFKSKHLDQNIMLNIGTVIQISQEFSNDTNKLMSRANQANYEIHLCDYLISCFYF